MNNTDVIYITKEGLDNLKNELNELVETKRPEVANRIKSAREMGDISENAEYDAARQEQAVIEGRIEELEEILKNARVTEAIKKDIVAVGVKVTLHVDGEEETFHIVGAPEADPSANKISHESPLGASLVGKKVGDKIDVEAPIGKLTYTILRIE
jgi:transcription elongation factor GreA